MGGAALIWSRFDLVQFCEALARLQVKKNDKGGEWCARFLPR
jgi:hypothetical protein